MAETLAEREQAARELLEAERAFQAVLGAIAQGVPAEPYASARTRLEAAQRRVEALLARGW